MAKNFEKNMKKEYFRKNFLEFSKSEFSEEVLEFYTQIIDLKSCKENNSEERNRIVKKYLNIGSVKEMNLTNIEKEKIAELLKDELDSSAYHKIEEIVFPVLIDSYIRFSKTKKFYEKRIECEKLSINTKKLNGRVKSFNKLDNDEQIFKNDWKIKEEGFKQSWNLGIQTKNFMKIFSPKKV
jgi:hypothetical protein